MNLLTVDLGNSRCKLRAWSEEGGGAPRLAGEADLPSETGIGGGIAAWLAGRPVQSAAVCSVVGAALELEVAEALRRSIDGPVDLAPDAGLSIACREPTLVGRDRLLGARAALELARGDALVVSLGTALTVDAVRADRTFLGGAIAPGPELLARALALGTARLPALAPIAGVPALGLDTPGALRAGIAVGLRGAARELGERVAAEAGLENATVVLTGGSRHFLLDPPVFSAARLRVERDLVHLGLLAARGKGR